MILIEVVCVSPLDFIMEAAQRDILLENIISIDDLTFRAYIERKDYARVLNIAEHYNCNIKILQQYHLRYRLDIVLKRPVLILGIIAILFLSVYLPTKIFFFEIKGNENVSESKILNCLEENGINFGISRRAIRSEQVKNMMLAALPELQWVGVNTYGCVAVISVLESNEPKILDDLDGISSIVSCSDGIVADIIVKRGTPLCSVGQAVKKGQKLISGYTDCGILIKGERAKGEVYGFTRRNLTAVIPSLRAVKREPNGSWTAYSIKVGKKLINLWKGSSNLTAECDKIYSEFYITLPGDFLLPIAFVKEVFVPYVPDPSVAKVAELDWVPICIEYYLHQQMVQGEILIRMYSDFEANADCSVMCQFFCKEMISNEQIEEIVR